VTDVNMKNQISKTNHKLAEALEEKNIFFKF